MARLVDIAPGTVTHLLLNLHDLGVIAATRCELRRKTKEEMNGVRYRSYCPCVWAVDQWLPVSNKIRTMSPLVGRAISFGVFFPNTLKLYAVDTCRRCNGMGVDLFFKPTRLESMRREAEKAGVFDDSQVDERQRNLEWRKSIDAIKAKMKRKKS